MAVKDNILHVLCICLDSDRTTKMSGKLTDKFMDQLEQWIGKGPKKFDLLYAITRDGCSNIAFHQKCDNQGPTVTVLYNQQGSVYGGYAAVSWNQSNTYINDAAAFLFRLQYNGTARYNKFPCKNAGDALFASPTYGPIFGSGHDLITFRGTINNSGGYFALNGNMNGMNNSYNNQGVATNQVNNGTMNVTELEVYKVTGIRSFCCVRSLFFRSFDQKFELFVNRSMPPPYRHQCHILIFIFHVFSSYVHIHFSVCDVCHSYITPVEEIPLNLVWRPHCPFKNHQRLI